jgi:hypothetical protein
MNWASGFITQIIYASLSSTVDDSYSLLTEDVKNIETENNNNIDIEH